MTMNFFKIIQGKKQNMTFEISLEKDSLVHVLQLEQPIFLDEILGQV